MNERNRDLLFNDDEDVSAVITLTDEDGNDVDAEVIAAIEIEELHKEFVAVLPQHPTEDLGEGEALILEYTEDESGDPDFSPVQDVEEYEIATAAFNQFFEQAQEFEEDEDSDTQSSVVDDINDILPGGISIQK